MDTQLCPSVENGKAPDKRLVLQKDFNKQMRCVSPRRHKQRYSWGHVMLSRLVPFSRTRLLSIGWYGLITLSLSFAWILLTCGLGLVWCLYRVHHTARFAPTRPSDCSLFLILGVCLNRDCLPKPDYVSRLRRAITLDSAHLLVLGGKTSDSCPNSEAEVGRTWLVGHGVDPANVQIEDGSSNTLENLRAARQKTEADGRGYALITNRYHLARSAMFARGLGLTLDLCAAEDRLRYTPRVCFLMLAEAIFINWYLTGRFTARTLRHSGMMKQIS